jgi:hypothetical protein
VTKKKPWELLPVGRKRSVDPEVIRASASATAFEAFRHAHIDSRPANRTEVNGLGKAKPRETDVVQVLVGARGQDRVEPPPADRGDVENIQEVLDRLERTEHGGGTSGRRRY